jgi:hypothetical protein
MVVMVGVCRDVVDVPYIVVKSMSVGVDSMADLLVVLVSYITRDATGVVVSEDTGDIV